ncbi:hypothetical protein GGS21DRAFT_493480 [Xylaria nigripes]|nr:hypothetical protein GGS21DRAFT_493480 [Xylaria nigripes]
MPRKGNYLGKRKRGSWNAINAPNNPESEPQGTARAVTEPESHRAAQREAEPESHRAAQREVEDQDIQGEELQKYHVLAQYTIEPVKNNPDRKGKQKAGQEQSGSHVILKMQEIHDEEAEQAGAKHGKPIQATQSLCNQFRRLKQRPSMATDWESLGEVTLTLPKKAVEDIKKQADEQREAYKYSRGVFGSVADWVGKLGQENLELKSDIDHLMDEVEYLKDAVRKMMMKDRTGLPDQRSRTSSGSKGSLS